MTAPAILEIRNLHKYFPVQPSLLDVILRKPQKMVRAVDGVSLSLEQGEVFAIVGESGCGKTTIARTLIGLEEQTAGEILFKNEMVGARERRQKAGFAMLESGKTGTQEKRAFPHMSLKRLRQQAQMIFQDPYESLNPRATIQEIVSEPLLVHGMTGSEEERTSRVISALEDTGLRPAEDYLLRYPHELSGGQRQRVVIAGAMVLKPELLIADEPVSMLDVSIRAEILNLLQELRHKHGVSIIFITHDLSTVAYFADRIAVMYLGRIVEEGPALDVLRNAQHPYTKALISVIPVPNPRFRRDRTILQGETPNPIDVPAGCRFHPRCPLVFDRCRSEDPVFFEVHPNKHAACWLVDKAAKTIK